MSAASAFAINTWWRSTERVRIVLSVPLPSSLATTSPATSATISGNSQIEPKISSTGGIARPVSRT